MIQRIQTIYLFLAATGLIGLYFLPLATASGDTVILASTGNNYFADGVFWEKELPAGLVTLLIGAISFISIFLYNNRPRQMQLALGMAVLAIIMTILFAISGYINAQLLPEGSAVHVSWGSAFPPIAILFLMLAYRAIGKDEKLVRSSDRLR